MTAKVGLNICRTIEKLTIDSIDGFFLNYSTIDSAIDPPLSIAGSRLTIDTIESQLSQNIELPK